MTCAAGSPAHAFWSPGKTACIVRSARP